MTAPVEPARGALGAYGLRISGIPEAARWMQPQDDMAPELRIHIEVSEPEDGPSSLNRDGADLRLIGGGRLQMDRGSSDVRFTLLFRPPDSELLHPYVTPAAALFWQWSGREAIHAGVFGVERGAVLVLGDKEAGKSTTLGWLALEGGASILSDDLAVIDGGSVLAGPRAIDLRVRPDRPDAVVEPVRGDERSRLTLDPAPERLPLLGLVVLDWGDAVAFEPVDLRDRFEIIDRQRTFRDVERNQLAMLELGSTPMVRARRPRDMGRLPEFGRALLSYFA